MGKIVTLGEIMLRLSTPGNTRFVQSDSFDVVYGGGEANVAVSCANYGHEAYFVTKLPKHEIGQSAVNALRKYGVKTDFITRGGDRVGIYYLETGASMRPSKVIYDRAHSAISEADPTDFDFDAIMEGADWFHLSGHNFPFFVLYVNASKGSPQASIKQSLFGRPHICSQILRFPILWCLLKCEISSFVATAA